MSTWLVLLAQVSVRPDPSGLPGTAQIQQLINGLAFWGLMACLGIFMVGGAAWAGGSRASNYAAVATGKNMVFGGAIGALLIGAAAAIVNFFHGVGQGVG